jgi:hypothetical protein
MTRLPVVVQHSQAPDPNYLWELATRGPSLPRDPDLSGNLLPNLYHPSPTLIGGILGWLPSAPVQVYLYCWHLMNIPPFPFLRPSSAPMQVPRVDDVIFSLAAGTPILPTKRTRNRNAAGKWPAVFRKSPPPRNFVHRRPETLLSSLHIRAQ